MADRSPVASSRRSIGRLTKHRVRNTAKQFDVWRCYDARTLAQACLISPGGSYCVYERSVIASVARGRHLAREDSVA
jgi:hypothetical protein